MDCNTARLYLQMGGLDADELQTHLGDCTACTHLAQDMKRLDDHLGRAMRSVVVPKEPKEQLLLRLAAERGARERRWAGYGLYGGLGVAAAFLLAWGLYALWGPAKPVIYADEVVSAFNILQRDQHASDFQLKQLGARGRAPSFVNYGYMVGEPALAILPSTQDDKWPVRVPQFFFAHGEHRAVVYVVPGKQYTVEDIAAPDPAYHWQMKVEADAENPGHAYLILYTGKDWAWLRQSGRGE
jgi:hypothetical protein